MCDNTLAVYCFINNFLNASGHGEGVRGEVTDAEVDTIALTVMLHFKIQNHFSKIELWKKKTLVLYF